MVSEVLSLRKISPKVVKMLKPVLCASKILTMQVFNLLDYNLLQKNKFAVNTKKLDIKEIIEQITEAVSPQAGLRGIKILVNISQEVPQNVYLDQNRLQQVLLNLLTNAIKFTSNGKIQVKCYGRPLISPT